MFWKEEKGDQAMVPLFVYIVSFGDEILIYLRFVLCISPKQLLVPFAFLGVSVIYSGMIK